MFRFIRRLKESAHRKKKGRKDASHQPGGPTSPDVPSRPQQEQELHPSQIGSSCNNDLIIKSNDPTSPFALASTVSAFVSPASPKTAASFLHKSDTITHKIKRRIKSVSASWQPVPLDEPSCASSAVPASAVAARIQAICNSMPLLAVPELLQPEVGANNNSSCSSSTTLERSPRVVFESQAEDGSCFGKLPVELLRHVLSFLPPTTHDMCNAAAVCWSWRELICGDSSLAARRRQHWRYVNWRAGRFYLRNTVPLKTHPIWQLLPQAQTKDKVFHYSGMDGTVQTLDLKSGELTASLTLPSQNFPVLAVNSSCTRLVISTKKGQGVFAVEEYDFKSGQLVRSIDAHTGWITCLQFLGENRVVSGSQDNSLKLWNLDSGECEKQFIGHAAGVTCLQLLRVRNAKLAASITASEAATVPDPAEPSVHLVSGSQDGTVRVWDVATGEVLRKLPCRFPVFTLHAENHLIVAAGCKKENHASEKGCLKLWNWKREILLRDLGSSQPRVADKGVAPISGVFLSGSRMLTVESGWMSFRCRKFRKAGAIRLWDINTGALIAKIADFRMREHTNKSQCVVSLMVDDDKNVIVGIEEMEHIKPSSLSHVFKIKSMVKVWSLKEGK